MREREEGGFLLVPSYTSAPLSSTFYYRHSLPSRLTGLPPTTTPASPPRRQRRTTTTATITTTIAFSNQHIGTITGLRGPLLEARRTVKEKKEVQDERETERGGGDYVGRRKRGDKEAKSNPRRDEQDGGTRRPCTRTERSGDEGRGTERENGARGATGHKHSVAWHSISIDIYTVSMGISTRSDSGRAPPNTTDSDPARSTQTRESIVAFKLPSYSGGLSLPES